MKGTTIKKKFKQINSYSLHNSLRRDKSLFITIPKFNNSSKLGHWKTKS